MDTMTLFGPLLCGIVLSIEWDFSCESTCQKHKFVCPSNIGEAKQIFNILKSCLYFVSFTHLSRSVWPNFQGNKRYMNLGYSWIVTPLPLLDLNQRLGRSLVDNRGNMQYWTYKDVWEVSISPSLSSPIFGFFRYFYVVLAAIRH